MTTTLAVQKQIRVLNFLWWISHRVVLDASKGDPDRASFKLQKRIITLDRQTMDFSYFLSAEPVDMNKIKPKDMNAYIQDLPNGMREIAQHISDSYKKARSTDTMIAYISYSELNKKLQSAMKNINHPDYEKYKKIYLSNWWDKTLIWE